MDIAKPSESHQWLTRFSQWLQNELDDGSVGSRPGVVEARLKILMVNLATPAVAGLVATVLGAPAIAIVATVMMAVGLVAARLNPQARAAQVAMCRHHVWGMLVGATVFRLLISWSNSSAPYGLPSLMGSNTSQIATMMGSEIMPALLYTTLTLIPLFYLRAVVEEYKSVRSRSDTHRDIAMVGRYRRARRY